MAVDATNEVMREKPVMIVWEFTALHVMIYLEVLSFSVSAAR